MKNKIETILLTNICTTEYGFINKKFIKKICKILEIKLQLFIKLKLIQRFNDKAAKPIIYVIYVTLLIGIYTENLVSLFITKLKHHPIIISQS